MRGLCDLRRINPAILNQPECALFRRTVSKHRSYVSRRRGSYGLRHGDQPPGPLDVSQLRSTKFLRSPRPVIFKHLS